MKVILALAAFVSALLLAAPAAAQETAATDGIPALETLLTLAAEKPDAWKEKPYDIAEGKVDLATYRGWRWFHGICHTCHGQDALGSTFAPNLTEVFGREQDPVTYESFLEIVMNGRAEVGEGQQPMLAFKTNKDIVKNIDNLYAYLKARADGALGRGRPQRQKKKN